MDKLVLYLDDTITINDKTYIHLTYEGTSLVPVTKKASKKKAVKKVKKARKVTPRKAWTSAEDLKLTALFEASVKTTDIAKELRRSIQVVYIRIKKLGLKKEPISLPDTPPPSE